MYVAHVNNFCITSQNEDLYCTVGMRTAIAMAWMIQDTVVNEDQAYMNMLAGNRIAEKHAQCKRASGPRVGKYFLTRIKDACLDFGNARTQKRTYLYSISWCTFDKKPRRVPILQWQSNK